MTKCGHPVRDRKQGRTAGVAGLQVESISVDDVTHDRMIDQAREHLHRSLAVFDAVIVIPHLFPQTSDWRLLSIQRTTRFSLHSPYRCKKRRTSSADVA